MILHVMNSSMTFDDGGDDVFSINDGYVGRSRGRTSLRVSLECEVEGYDEASRYEVSQVLAPGARLVSPEAVRDPLPALDLGFALFALDHAGDGAETLRKLEDVRKGLRELWSQTDAVTRDAYERRAEQVRVLLGKTTPTITLSRARREDPTVARELWPSASDGECFSYAIEDTDRVKERRWNRHAPHTAPVKTILLRRIPMKIDMPDGGSIRWFAWERAS